MAFQIFERWGLNAREQRLATGAAIALAVALVLAIPIGLTLLVSSRQAEIDDLKSTLTQVNSSRGKIRDRQQRRAMIQQRYQKKAPPLGGFLEQVAGMTKVQISDSQDRPDANRGKQFVERQTVAHLKNTGMGALAKFLETIETSGYPVTVNRINIRRRMGEPDSYGPVEIGISAFDRNATPAPAAEGTK
jgi:general secretion pathway protein M